MAHLVKFQNPDLDHPEDGNESPRTWTGYPDRAEELLYELLFTLQNV